MGDLLSELTPLLEDPATGELKPWVELTGGLVLVLAGAAAIVAGGVFLLIRRRGSHRDLQEHEDSQEYEKHSRGQILMLWCLGAVLMAGGIVMLPVGRMAGSW